MLTGVSAAPAPAQQAEPTLEITDLGTAALGANVRNANAAVLPDGTPIMYLLNNAEPAVLFVLNAETGELLDSVVDEEERFLAASTTVASDGSLWWVTRDGKGSTIHHYDPATSTDRIVATSPAGEAVIRRVKLSDDESVLYGSTYPNAKMWAIDTETGELLEDYGTVVPDGSNDSYIWGFERIDDTLYGGSALGEGHLMQVDANSGEVTPIEIPEKYESLQYFYDFRKLTDDLIAMSFSKANSSVTTNTLLWQHSTQSFICEDAVPITAGNYPFTDADENGVAYFRTSEGIFSFDPSDCSVEPTDFGQTDLAELPNPSRIRQLQVPNDDGVNESVLLGALNDGTFWTYNLDTGATKHHTAEHEGLVLTAHSLHEGPDNQLYIGTYLGPGAIGTYDPASGEKGLLDGPKQADEFVNISDSEMLITSYPGGIIDKVDLNQEWAYGDNPSRYARLRDTTNQTDRLLSIDAKDGLVAIGAVADYGYKGGSLVITDAEGNERFYDNILGEQSITSVKFGSDGLLYIGSNVRGGLSSPADPGPVSVAVVDPADGSVLHQEAVDTGLIGAMAEVDGTMYFTNATGTVLALDMTSRELTTVVEQDLGAISPWGLSSSLEYNTADGLIYGTHGSNLYVIDPTTGEVVVTDDSIEHKRLEITEAGEVYVISSTNLYRIQLAGVETPTPTTPAPTGDQTGPTSSASVTPTGTPIRPGLPDTGTVAGAPILGLMLAAGIGAALLHRR
ncbi:hypothetical protein CGZ92_08835 [Parenemella sanctibonifatiensis]|uniref:Pyrrolo-quinoline quinone repeat domain-containing protein n=1 Tax=Parenemella sanctibonifatiensis TaxID=2016505 RepID=A0A255E4G8_9ACTN|nr:hypothetical protein CGZ92_08835 [Parenemella sanctibonifatiensis]